MKKILSMLTICCVSLLAGVFLCSCSNDAYNVQFSMDEKTEQYVELGFSTAGEKIEIGEKKKFKVASGDAVKVEITANQYGVDFSNLVITVNGADQEIILNSKYSPFSSGESLMYGHFVLAKGKNCKIELSGVDKITSTFSFDAVGLDDEEVVSKLKMTQVCVTFDDLDDETGETAPEYKNLYDLVTAEERFSFTRTFDEREELYNRYNSIRVEIEGVIPFDLENANPFGIMGQNGVADPVVMTQYGDIYVLGLGELLSYNDYKIVVDYSNIEYRTFNISLPEKNMTYEVLIDKETINYNQEGLVSVKKLLDSSKVDYTNMKVSINTLELEKVGESDDGLTVQFKIPKNITPCTTGGGNVYRISVSGYQYLVPSYILRANSIEGLSLANPLIIPSIWLVNDNGDKLGFSGVNENGEYTSLEGLRNAVIWSYNYDEVNQAYYSKSDLYDYDINANQEKILNVKEQLAGATADVTKSIAGGYTFKAFYNSTTGKFDSFQLEFVCSKETTFEFTNFQDFTKNIDVSYSFEDPRIERIEYAIATENSDFQNLEWAELTKDESIKLAVTGQAVVCFRLTSQSPIGSHEFKIENQKISNSKMEPLSVSADGKVYTVLRYIVSNIQYDGDMSFKLIP